MACWTRKVPSTMKDLRFYPTRKLTGWLAAVLWMLAEGTGLLNQTRYFITHSTAGSMSIFVPASFASPPPPATPVPKGQCGACQVDACLQWVQNRRNPALRYSQSFSRGWQQTCLNFAPREMLFLLFLTANKSSLFPRGRYHLYLSKTVGLQTSLKRESRTKAASASTQKMCRYMRETWKTVPPKDKHRVGLTRKQVKRRG